MKRIAIIGSAHLGQQIAHHIHTDTEDKVVAFFDDFQPKGTIIDSISVIGGTNDVLEEYSKNSFDELLIGVGYNHMNTRKMLFEKYHNDIPFYKFIHSSCYVDPSAEIGAGTVIYPRCVIDQNVKIGNNVLINISSSIAHDTTIGTHSFISPCVSMAGFVDIKEQCIIGINSIIIDNISITEGTRTGGGTVVIKNIEEKGLYVGNPARFVR